MLTHQLSKSTFIRGSQCLKSLYLHNKRPFLRDKLSIEQLAKFNRGHIIGKLAQQLFPGGINCAPYRIVDLNRALVKTKDAIEKDNQVIYEATFEHDGVLVILDILVKSPTGWKAYEVKSSSGVSPTYYLDAALQYHVITGSGFDLESLDLVYINPDYTLENELNIHSLFMSENVTERCIEMQPKITTLIEQCKDALNLSKSPPISISPHCYQPYPCDFMGHCWKDIDNSSILRVKGINLNRRYELYNTGITSSNYKEAGIMTDWEISLFNAHLSGHSFVDKQAVKLYLNHLHFQPCFVYFSICKPPVPQIIGYKPYEPFIDAIALIDPDNEYKYYQYNKGIEYHDWLKEVTTHLKIYETICYTGDKPTSMCLEKEQEFFNHLNLTDILRPVSEHWIFHPHVDIDENIFSIAKELGYIYSPVISIEDLNKIYYSHLENGMNFMKESVSDAYHHEWLNVTRYIYKYIIGFCND